MAAISRLAWSVLALALVGALASTFGPQARWHGIDIDSTGAAVFGVSLWVGVWLFARHRERVFPPAWSIAERRAWAGLVFVLLIALSYVRFMTNLAEHGAAPSTWRELSAEHFIRNVIVLLIAWAVVSATISGSEPDVVESDERDQRLRRAADQAGDWALSIIVIWCVGLLVGLPAQRLTWWLAPLIAAHVLIGILIAKTAIEHVYLVTRYAWERR